MRHRKADVKLGRTASHREAMLRNMVTSLFEHGRIRTTLSKAKALRPLADRMVGLAKTADLHCLRQAAAVITKRSVLDKLFGEASGRFGDRGAGFTLMVKTGLRAGDAATMVILELTGAGRSQATVGGGKGGAAGKGDRAKRVAQSAKKAPEGPKRDAQEAGAAADEAPAAAPETTETPGA